MLSYTIMSTTASLTGAETAETSRPASSSKAASAEVEVASVKAGSSKAGFVEPKKQPKGKGKAVKPSGKSKKAKEEEGSDFAMDSDGSESDDAGSVGSSAVEDYASVDQDEDLEDVIEEEDEVSPSRFPSANASERAEG